MVSDYNRRNEIMKLVIFCAIGLLSTLGFVACGSQGESRGSANSSSYRTIEFAATSNRSAGSTSASETTDVAPASDSGELVLKQNVSLAQTSASSIDTAPVDRKVIRNADLDLEDENPEAAQRKVTSIAESKGGFVVESQQSSSDIQSTTRDTVLMSVRVPSAKFSEALDEIRQSVSRVVLETVKGQDVTEEFIDIEAQLRAKKALEEQFMTIMKQANGIAEAMNVQRQLAEVRGEIERIEGRKRFLANQSSLSTIKIRVQTPKAFAASSAGIGTRISEAFAAGFEVAMAFVLGVITFVVAALPFGVLIGLPLFVIVRYLLRRQARPRSVTDIAQDEI